MAVSGNAQLLQMQDDAKAPAGLLERIESSVTAGGELAAKARLLAAAAAQPIAEISFSTLQAELLKLLPVQQVVPEDTRLNANVDQLELAIFGLMTTMQRQSDVPLTLDCALITVEDVEAARIGISGLAKNQVRCIQLVLGNHRELSAYSPVLRALPNGASLGVDLAQSVVVAQLHAGTVAVIIDQSGVDSLMLLIPVSAAD